MENVNVDLEELLADVELDLDTYGRVQTSTLGRLSEYYVAVAARTKRAGSLTEHERQAGHRLSFGCCGPK